MVFYEHIDEGSRWAETPEFWAEQKNGKDNNFQLVSHWVFSMSFKMTKVKLLFLYRFSVLSFICIISHSPAMAGAWDRISMFWGERKIWKETYLHLKLLSPNGWRARVHYIGYKALEKITEHYWWQKAFQRDYGGDRGAGGWGYIALWH